MRCTDTACLRRPLWKLRCARLLSLRLWHQGDYEIGITLILAWCTARLEEDLGLALATEEDTSKYFPASNSSREVRDRLVGACLEAGAQLRCKASVEGIQWQQGPDQDSGARWHCILADASVESADSLVRAHLCKRIC